MKKRLIALLAGTILGYAITMLVPVGDAASSLSREVGSKCASALPSQDVFAYYYSDNTFETLVGEEWVTSCYFGVLHNLLWGTRTNYKVTRGFPCDSGGPYECLTQCYCIGTICSCPTWVCDVTPDCWCYNY